MPISNPTAYNHNSKGFTYEGGDTLYHFSPHDNGWSTTMECNIIFFANSEDHARDVLARMFEHVLEELVALDEKRMRHYQLDRLHDTRVSWYKRMLNNVLTKDVEFEKAPTNQVFCVGWASNDNIK